MDTKRILVFGGFSVSALCIGSLITLAVAPLPEGLAVEGLKATALTLCAITFWATGILPEYVTALVFFFLAMIFDIAPASVVFSGFQSAALWLIFSGLILGVAIKQTGLGEQLARPLIRLCGGSYLRLTVGLVVMSLALTFVMPSTIGRTVLLIPIVVALADHLGLPAGSRSRNGLILATAVATYMPAAAILPASVPNMVLYGAAETLHAIHLTYGRYLLLHFPITGLLKASAIVTLTWLLFRDAVGRPTPVEATKPFTRQQWSLSIVLLVALGLWMSDGWHHISPAWIGLGGALICLMPGIELVPYASFHRDINLTPVVYIAGILGLGAVIAQSGLGQILGERLLGLLDVIPDQDRYTFASLIGMAMTLGMATTMPGVPAILTPFAPQLSQAVEWPVLTVLMTQVIGYSTVLLPYQAPPIVLAMQLGGVSIAAGTRFLLAIFVTTILLLMPLNYLWWCLLGYIGPTS